MDNNQEVWVDLPHYEGLYKISSFGQVLSLYRGKYKRDKILKPSINIHGYYQLTLCKNGIHKNWRIHILVAMAFLNHNPNGTHYICVDHINENKIDNNVSNLQLISSRANITKHKILKNKSSKYTGVSYMVKNNKWKSEIYYNKSNIYLGLFNNELDAHYAYQKKLKEITNGKI